VQLGFDMAEVSKQVVTLVGGHQRKVPKIAPIEIVFANRSYVQNRFGIAQQNGF